MSTPSSVTIRLFIRATSARITSFTASLSTEGFASSCHAPCPRQQPKGRWAGETLTLQQPQHRGTVLGSLINLTHEPAYLGYSALAQKTRCGSVEGLPYIEAAGLKQNPKTPTISLHPRPHLSAHRQRHVPGRRVPRRPAPRKNMDW